MCLFLNTDFERKERHATEDIKCYKVATRWGENTVMSYHQAFKYILKQLYTTTINIKLESVVYGQYIVEEGFHSFTTYDEAYDYWLKTKDCCDVIECVIPAGSTYYIGRYGYYHSYVSNQIRLEKIIENDVSLKLCYKPIKVKSV